jgi:hypothetical protein
MGEVDFILEKKQFAQAYERLRAKIVQERRKAKQIGRNVWIILAIVFLFILLSGGEWYWFVICIIGALVYGSYYSNNAVKKIEKETGLTVYGQEAILRGSTPFRVQDLSRENRDKYFDWLTNNND